MDLLQVIKSRRDTRHFTGEIVPKAVLDRALEAALHAPSVGLSQPCRFIDISSSSREALIENFANKRLLAEMEIDDQRRLALHRSIKLESLADAPILLAIFCAYPVDEYTIGVIGNRRALEWSCACAIQNLWLLLTAEGFGAGWVTILDLQALAAKLDVPSNWEAMGIICIGKPATDYEGKPMLEQMAWQNRDLNSDHFYSSKRI
ncbi:MAG: 5,6-dimethylbenzimidazole synthase [Oligoflexus sp.]